MAVHEYKNVKIAKSQDLQKFHPMKLKHVQSTVVKFLYDTCVIEHISNKLCTQVHIIICMYVQLNLTINEPPQDH